MQLYVYWFVAAFGVLALEMMTGTFYMLVLSLALGAGGLMALAGTGTTAQLSATAVVAVLGTLALRTWKTSRQHRETPQQDLDVGQSVRVETWRPDGTARVWYRGAHWDAELDTPDTPRDQPLYIKSRRSAVLILTHQPPLRAPIV